MKLGGLESSGTERDSYWGSPSLKLSNFICPSPPPPTAPSAGLRPSINEVRVIRMATRWRRRPAVWTLKCSGPRPGTGSALRKPECSEEVLGVGDIFWCAWRLVHNIGKLCLQYPRVQKLLVSRHQEGTGPWGGREGDGRTWHSENCAVGQRRGAWECVGNTRRQRKGHTGSTPVWIRAGWVTTGFGEL